MLKSLVSEGQATQPRQDCRGALGIGRRSAGESQTHRKCQGEPLFTPNPFNNTAGIAIHLTRQMTTGLCWVSSSNLFPLELELVPSAFRREQPYLQAVDPSHNSYLWIATNPLDLRISTRKSNHQLDRGVSLTCKHTHHSKHGFFHCGAKLGVSEPQPQFQRIPSLYHGPG